MKVIVCICIIACFSNCITSHKFRDEQIKILPRIKIPANSIHVVNPVVVGFNYPSFNKAMYHPIDLHSRPDSIREKLERKLSSLFINKIDSLEWQNRYIDLYYNSIEKVYSDQKLFGQRARWVIDSISLSTIIAEGGFDQSAKDILVFIFRLETSEVEYASQEIWDYILGSVVLLQNGNITLYRQFSSNIRFNRRYFPKGSEDRSNFPHFPQWQIDKVVDALVEDLKKRVQ